MSIGFFGKILRIDLSNEKIDTISPPIEIYRNYIGGYGLGCRLLYELMPPKIDPLSEASYLGFFPGLLTSTTAPF
ncbi:MAG: aldehyde ferredoxin oxidoreductase N-terminal domain-containing protein, partial [Promethearchaeota archaeon]